MSERIKNDNYRLKILYIYRILKYETDEDHPITMAGLISRLEELGIEAERKAVSNDIRSLEAFGLDIIHNVGRYAGYYVATRDFELVELKLLADAVSSARFLTEKKSNELLKKIGKLASRYEAGQLSRQVYVANRVKSINELIYINVDTINTAISLGRKIAFKYFDYDVNKKKKYHEGIKVCSPYALVWSDEKYYLIGYYENRETITNFRVDRMEKIDIKDEKSAGKPKDFNVADYMNSSFSMFSGESDKVTLRLENKLVNVVFDKFGRNIPIIKDGNDHFLVTVTVKTQQPEPFFGWLFQFGDKAEITNPPELKKRYSDELKKVLSNYE